MLHDMRSVLSGIWSIAQIRAVLFSLYQPSPVSERVGFKSALMPELWVQTAGYCPQFGQSPCSPFHDADTAQWCWARGQAVLCCSVFPVLWPPGCSKETLHPPCSKVRLPQLIHVLAGLPDERNVKYLDSFFYGH